MAMFLEVAHSQLCDGQAFAAQQARLPRRSGRTLREPPAGGDHPPPRHLTSLGQRRQGVSNVASNPPAPQCSGHIAIGRDPANRNGADKSVDLRVESGSHDALF